MRGFCFFAASMLLLMAPAATFAGNGDDNGDRHEKLDSIVVSASRAGKSTPVTYTMVGKQELREANPINSLPMILNLQPSVVTYNEGGTGLGNSAMTIRGSKGSQINVTLNGVTLNDAESQEVFWVNIPSLASLISSVQLQRGLGTTANGAGAFGASVNMSTASVSPDPFVNVDVSGGSWNTFETTVAAGTGLSEKGFYANAAYSRGYTDGYIRNAKVRSQSAFVALGWLQGNNSLRFTYLMGDQKSGITWNGIDIDMYYKDRRYNDAGEYYDQYGNVHYYDNAIDAYNQHHLQLNYTHSFSDKLTWTTTANYTRGDGYDEYYKSDKKISNYGMPGTLRSDIIYQKKMGNDYYVLNSDLKYNSENLRMVGGINVSKYDGDHFGKVLWVAQLGDGYDYAALGQTNSSTNSWYWNNGTKYDASAHLRSELDLDTWLTLFADLQYRYVNFDLQGVDDDYASLDYKNTWNFFNPRVGVNFNISPTQRAYASASLGHREPGRGDIKENVKGELTPIKPEKMYDFEIGYNYTGSKFVGSANIYLMEYSDMLLETGRLSSSGYAIKENIDRGWRRGLELAGAYMPAEWIRFDANTTLSINQIKDYTDYAEVRDGALYETKVFNYGKTTMLMSPSVIGMAKVSVTPWKNSARGSLKTTTLSLDGKYVGKQYIDNTERAEMEIPSYFVSNLSLSHEFNVGGGKLGLTGYVNNLLNNMYYASGWRWEGYTKATDELTTGIGVYPQAPINFMFKVSYRF